MSNDLDELRRNLDRLRVDIEYLDVQVKQLAEHQRATLKLMGAMVGVVEFASPPSHAETLAKGRRPRPSD